jgi:hypothetical protein
MSRSSGGGQLTKSGGYTQNPTAGGFRGRSRQFVLVAMCLPRFSGAWGLSLIDFTPINAALRETSTGDCGLLTIRNAFFTTVSRIGLSRRFCGVKCSCPTSTKESWGAIPPLSGRLVQPRKVSQTTKAASLVGMASLFDLDGLVGGYRAMAFESPVQHRPPAYGVLSEWRFRNSYPGDGLG